MRTHSVSSKMSLITPVIRTGLLSLAGGGSNRMSTDLGRLSLRSAVIDVTLVAMSARSGWPSEPGGKLPRTTSLSRASSSAAPSSTCCRTRSPMSHFSSPSTAIGNESLVWSTSRGTVTSRRLRRNSRAGFCKNATSSSNVTAVTGRAGSAWSRKTFAAGGFARNVRNALAPARDARSKVPPGRGPSGRKFRSSNACNGWCRTKLGSAGAPPPPRVSSPGAVAVRDATAISSCSGTAGGRRLPLRSSKPE